MDPLDLSPDTALLRLARGDLGSQEGVGFGDFVDAINQRRSERNFGQNLLLDVAADRLNLAPGLGFTNLATDVTRGGFRFAPQSLLTDRPPSFVQRTIPLPSTSEFSSEVAADIFAQQVDELGGRMEVLNVNIDIARVPEGVVRPTWATGTSNQQLRAIAVKERLNPYLPDWAVGIDPVLIREARAGRFKTPGQKPLAELTQERTRLRQELKDTNARLDAELQLPPLATRVEGLQPHVAAPLRIEQPRPPGIPIEASTPEAAARLRALVHTPATTGEQVEHLAGVARNEAPPDDPVKLLKRVSRPEGKPRLSDPPAFGEEVRVGSIQHRAARFVRALATPVGPLDGKNRAQTIQLLASMAVRNPVMRGILRWTPGLRNPHLFAENSTQTAGLIRAGMIDDGRQKIVGLAAHARKFGNQDALFGRTVDATGLLESGPFKGRSVNELAENPSRFNLTTQQRNWLDAMDGLEGEILDFYKRNGIPISEVPLVDIERYAGRVHVARILEDGTIIERGFAGGGRRLVGRTGSQQQRVFTTVAESQKEGFIPLSYEQGFAVRAQSAYNKVVNQRASDWIRANLPSGWSCFPSTPLELRTFGSGSVSPRV